MGKSDVFTFELISRRSEYIFLIGIMAENRGV